MNIGKDAVVTWNAGHVNIVVIEVVSIFNILLRWYWLSQCVDGNRLLKNNGKVTKQQEE